MVNMDMEQRNEAIWKMRCQGASYSQIARQFDLSSDRVRQIYRQRQASIENFGRWPPLKRELSARVTNVLVKTFGSEEILNHPEKLSSLGEEVFITWRNFGRKSLNELTGVLEKLGYSVNRNVRITDMKSMSYFEIGRTILRKYFDYSTKNSLDDMEYVPVVRLIIEG